MRRVWKVGLVGTGVGKSHRLHCVGCRGTNSTQMGGCDPHYLCRSPYFPPHPRAGGDSAVPCMPAPLRGAPPPRPWSHSTRVAGGTPSPRPLLLWGFWQEVGGPAVNGTGAGLGTQLFTSLVEYIRESGLCCEVFVTGEKSAGRASPCSVVCCAEGRDLGQRICGVTVGFLLLPGLKGAFWGSEPHTDSVCWLGELGQQLGLKVPLAFHHIQKTHFALRLN